MAEKQYRSIDEIMHNGKPLREILEAHRAWVEKGKASHGERANLSWANLIRANLSRADLIRANLSRANLRWSNLTEANLNEADLSGANLDGADLRRTTLREAIMTEVSLFEADLRGADLMKAHLAMVNLSRVDLHETNLTECSFGFTKVADCDLSSTIGLEMATHFLPSTIGVDTILRSQGKIPEVFLKGAGVPDLWITYVKSLVANPIEFYSCFISYSHHDEEFVESLYTQLQAKGVRCWYFPEDATWGNKVQREIGAGLRLFDQVVVVCSQQSLDSGPVIAEIERALQREDQEKRDVLFPIRIDNYLFGKWANKGWEDAYKSRLTSKVIGSFEDWKSHDAFRENFEKLLKALNRKQPE